MSREVCFNDLVEAAVGGAHPMELVEANIGAERRDDFTAEDVKVQEFARIAGQYGGAYPHINGPNWVNVISDQLRGANAQGQSELIQMAERNRSQYEGSARIDCEGSFDLWSGILAGLLATRTDQLPPQQG